MSHRVLSREMFKLPCELTDREVQDRGQELASVAHEKTALRDERKATAKRLKDAIDDCDERGSDLAREIRDRAEEREVECEERLYPERKRVEWVRLDTEEPVGRGRRAKASELQGELFAVDSLAERDTAL